MSRAPIFFLSFLCPSLMVFKFSKNTSLLFGFFLSFFRMCKCRSVSRRRTANDSLSWRRQYLEMMKQAWNLRTSTDPIALHRLQRSAIFSLSVFLKIFPIRTRASALMAASRRTLVQWPKLPLNSPPTTPSRTRAILPAAPLFATPNSTPRRSSRLTKSIYRRHRPIPFLSLHRLRSLARPNIIDTRSFLPPTVLRRRALNAQIKVCFASLAKTE
mmetsp:Transcript_19663/g.36574  ORF Transcript_19663/g.36574 Transcript_19663/m.36574 type:complete len:215 (-) Transcript_19663:1318-1962(-)